VNGSKNAQTQKEIAVETSVASQARQIVLSRVRAALQPQQPSQPAVDTAWSSIPRNYRRSSEASAGAVLELLTSRLHDYDALVLRSTRTEVTRAVAQMLTARNADRLLVPPGFPETWLPEGFTYVRDEQLPHALLDSCGGVITTCTLAIAETGTIVLQNASGQGRRAASLVPDYHLCLIEAARVFATVPEAIDALQPDSILPTTFISGPSATADIEMTRIKGVHGPRFLDVILIV
jgi:L-lactate dehydrogenase complex protein LldG